MKKNISIKAAAIMLAVGLMAGGAVGGTLAWLSTTSNTVTNTFTAGNIKIELNETDLKDGTKSFKMLPGTEITKDPKVKFTANSEACWLFVKIDENGEDTSGNTIIKGGVTSAIIDETYLTYEVNYRKEYCWKGHRNLRCLFFFSFSIITYIYVVTIHTWKIDE